MESWVEKDNLKTDSLRFRITLKLLDLVEEACNDPSYDRCLISGWIKKIKLTELDFTLYNDMNKICREVEQKELKDYLSNEEHCYFDIIKNKKKDESNKKRIIKRFSKEDLEMVQKLIQLTHWFQTRYGGNATYSLYFKTALGYYEDVERMCKDELKEKDNCGK